MSGTVIFPIKMFVTGCLHAFHIEKNIVNITFCIQMKITANTKKGSPCLLQPFNKQLVSNIVLLSSMSFNIHQQAILFVVCEAFHAMLNFSNQAHNF